MMSGAGGVLSTQSPPIAGFWIRLLAQIIDGAVWGALATLTGVALVAAAPETFGLKDAPFQTMQCRRLTSAPPGFALPADFNSSMMVQCRKSAFGFPFRDEVIATERRTQGNTWVAKSYTQQVDPELRPRSTFDLSIPLSLSFLGYIVFAEGLFGTTLGKRLLRLRVVGGGMGVPGLKAASIRNLVLCAPALVAYALILPLVLLDVGFGGAWLVIAVGGLSFLLALALVVNIWWTASHERPSVHDRVAGTRVVRLDRHWRA